MGTRSSSRVGSDRRLGPGGLAVVVAAIAVGSPLGAQVQVSAESRGGFAAAGSVRETLPWGPVPPGGRLEVQATQTNGACMSIALAGVSSHTLGARVHASADSNDPIYWGCAMAASAAANGRVTFSAPAPTRGVLAFRVSSTSGASFSVDVGADGSREYTSAIGGPSTFRVPVVVGPDPLAVSVAAAATASSPSVFFLRDSSSVLVDFIAGAAGLDSGGSPCGPAVGAFVTDQRWAGSRQLVFLASGSPVTPHAFFLLGLTPQNLVIPPTGCVLHTDILIPVLSQVDANGRARLVGTLPLGPARFRLQFLAATTGPGGDLWQTSNVIVVALP